jgi:hypothetical protein
VNASYFARTTLSADAGEQGAGLGEDVLGPPVQAIAIDSGNLYYTDAGGYVMKIPSASTNVPGTTVKLASGQGACLGVAVDATSVYWTTPSGAVMKVAK